MPLVRADVQIEPFVLRAILSRPAAGALRVPATEWCLEAEVGREGDYLAKGSFPQSPCFGREGPW